MPYIVCEKRKGNPKVNVEVCRRKCKFTEECKPYNRYLDTSASEEFPQEGESHVAAFSHEDVADTHVRAA